MVKSSEPMTKWAGFNFHIVALWAIGIYMAAAVEPLLSFEPSM
jgi:hypothetical protein